MSKHKFQFIRKHPPHNRTSTDIHSKLDVAIISYVYHQSTPAIFTALFCASLVSLAMYKTNNTPILLIWYSLFAILTLTRYILIKIYMKGPASEDNIHLWRRLYIFTGFLGGLSWGITSMLLFSNPSQLQHTFIILTVCAACAGAVPSFSGILPACIIFICGALIPLSFAIYFSEIQDGQILLSIATLAYLTYLISLAVKSHSMIKASIGLQFQNNSLLNNLSDAKTQLENINKKLEQAATHDPLTHVGNRNLFADNISKAIELAQQNQKIIALLYLDIDGFKKINDAHGHHIGDRVLLALTNRLEDMFRNQDVIARLGGDEFTILLENIITPYDIAKIARRVCVAMSTPIHIDQLILHVSVSIGISIYPTDAKDAENLLNIADKAMYQVKVKGGNNFHFNIHFSPSD